MTNVRNDHNQGIDLKSVHTTTEWFARTHTNNKRAHTHKQMFHTVCWRIHAHCLIAGLWNLQVASAKQFPNGCQAVAVTAGRDLPVTVDDAISPAHLVTTSVPAQHWQPEHNDSNRATISQLEWVYCSETLRGKMLISSSKPFLYTWCALSINDHQSVTLKPNN